MTASQELVIAVLGAGHGGRAMAADLAARGFRIRLFNRTLEHIEAIQARGGIELQLDDEQSVFGEIEMASHRVEEVISGCHLLMVVVPASGHADIARAVAPYLVDNQIIVQIRDALEGRWNSVTC